jgi:hypothetical protein
MKIFLKPGETLEIGTMGEDGDPNDGTFTISFDTPTFKDKLVIESDMPGNVKGDEGVIYEENFSLISDNTYAFTTKTPL